MSRHEMPRKKIGIDTLRNKKLAGEKITMLTAYDYPTAKLVDECEIDCILVGDSVGNVLLGYDDTVAVTMDDMLHHAKAVCRAKTAAFVIGDMPFGSYNLSADDAVRNATRFLKEAGCDGVKLEGGAAVAEKVRAIVTGGIPVVGHLGLTPQTAAMIGGYRMQGGTSDAAGKILADALLLEEAGVCMLVLECIPTEVAAEISRRLSVPVIGIGAGSGCDGQVLVINDMLGMQSGFTPKFVKRFLNLDGLMREAVQAYRKEVTAATFPAAEQSFAMKPEEHKKFAAGTDATSEVV